VLRFEGYGMASPVVAFPHGKPPESYVLQAGLAKPVGGRVVDSAGQPLADKWVYLSRGAAPAIDASLRTSDASLSILGVPIPFPGASLGAVKTDADGRWQANLHPADAADFALAVPDARGSPKFFAGQPVDPYKAAAGSAITTVAPPSSPGATGKGKGK